MADAIVSFGVEKLWVLVSQEYNRLQGVGEQITELKSYLNMLMSFLSDAAGAKNHKSALARNCLEEIKEITYDAEDIIETFLVKEEQRNGSGMKNHVRSLACILGGRRKTSLEITSITKRISRVINVMQTFGIKADIMKGGYSQALQDMRRETRHPSISNEPESNLIGLEENVKTVVGLLVGNDGSHWVSITGMAGLGKTTLARQVFNNDKVKRHFNGGLAWVCVSQDFTPKDVWQTILQNLSHGDGDYVASMKKDELQKNRSPKERKNLSHGDGDYVASMKKDELQKNRSPKERKKMEEDKLNRELSRLLEKKKALIVFDDVWPTEDWEKIKLIFPERNEAGWKVLLTSRFDDIHPTCEPFKPELLKGDQDWTFLHMILQKKGYIIDQEMVKMAKDMVKHCGRLPLAVKVLGGWLAAQHTLRQWKMISENIKSHIVRFNDNDSSSVNYILSLSFEGLPGHLKHCLLHLASYPEDHRINLEDVSYRWAAEGITKPWHYEKATSRDVSDDYIEELVKRNLVISERDMGTWRFEFCRLHDMMREVCLLKAKEEKFFKIVTLPACSSSVHSQTSNRSRRLVVHTSDQDSDELYTRFNGEREIKNSKLRSLLFIPVDGYTRFMMGSNFMELQLLRVLDLSRAVFKGRKLPSNIGKLIHLKYLSLYEAKVTHLPSSIGNLKSLLYLNLGIRKCHVPNVLKEMQELRYLHLPRSMHKKTKLELGGLLKLETLINFSIKYSSVMDLHRMKRLRSLSICTEGFTEETLASTLSKLRDLENLTIYAHKNFEKRSVLDCVLLKKPKSRMDITRLPEWQHFPSHLTTIELRLFYLEEDPMPILEKLPHLKGVKLSRNEVCAMKMVSRGFPKLQKLELIALFELEEWIVEERSMPHLHTLVIWRCPKLKEIPDGLRFLDSLKDLTMDWKWEERLSFGGADHDKVKHIPSVNCDKDEAFSNYGWDSYTGNLEMSKVKGDSLKEWKERLSEGGADHDKVKHIPSVNY